MRKRVIRYSEAFKQEVVRELESGIFENAAQASRRYGIKGEGTVKRWAGQYGRNGNKGTGFVSKRSGLSRTAENSSRMVNYLRSLVRRQSRFLDWKKKKADEIVF